MNAEQRLEARQQLIRFLQRMVQGQVDVDDWNAHMTKRYADEALEAARRRLADAVLSRGQCSARPVPDGMGELAQEVLDELEMLP